MNHDLLFNNSDVNNYVLVVEGKGIDFAHLTKKEAQIKNYAFGLNGVNKRYESVIVKRTPLRVFAGKES